MERSDTDQLKLVKMMGFAQDSTHPTHHRHCEERSDEAIQGSAYAARWIASLRSQ
jgi:hypothetical protein